MTTQRVEPGKKLVLFDFDGTLTNRDTLFEILCWVDRRAFYPRFFYFLPQFFLVKIRLISAESVKERWLAAFLKGMTPESFQAQCDRFVQIRLPGLLRPEAVRVLKRFKSEGADVFVVSASAENWIKPWCEGMGVGCIASQLEVVDGQLTGRLRGNNCNGEEKVNRIKARIQLSDYSEIFAFGDSSGDRPMLALAGKYAFFRTFNI